MDHPFHTEEFTREGVDFVAKFFSDDGSMGWPWNEDGGWGIVRYVPRGFMKGHKKPGEVLLLSNRGVLYLYDFAGTIKKAREEGWGLGGDEAVGLTKRQVIERAVQNDMENVQAWIDEDVYWCCLTVSPADDDSVVESLAGVEWDTRDDGEYAKESAQELADQILYDRRKQAEKDALEAAERNFWAERDVLTT